MGSRVFSALPSLLSSCRQRSVRAMLARRAPAEPARAKVRVQRFGAEITRDASKRIVCSSANTFKRSRVYFQYGCGSMQAGAAARALQSPYKPWLCLQPSPPPKRGRRGPRGPAGSSTLPPRHARTADGRERSLAAPWSPPARDADGRARVPPETPKRARVRRRRLTFDTQRRPFPSY